MSTQIATTPVVRKIRHGHTFCGGGFGAKGFNRGEARVGVMRGEFVCVGGIDSSPAAIRDFNRHAGVRGTVLDLFTREQYIAFHGKEPPPGWRECSVDDYRRAFVERPNIMFLSAPCKGFSGLLAETMSRTAKYQALNGLTLRGVWLMLEAYKDDPIELIIFENVPRIMQRGRHLLEQIIALFRVYGYAVAETTHDCGELGNLAQTRKRFLMVARYVAKVPNFLYEPIKRPLRGVGEVLDKLPVPGLGLGGPMHRMPSLQWKTWVRLAFVEAGSDWRSLNKLNVADGVLSDYGIEPDASWHAGVLGVRPWEGTAGTITSRSGPTNGAHAVADPRVAGHPKSVQLGIRRWNETAPVVKGDVSVGTGPYTIADPRIDGKPRFNNVFRIVPFSGTSPAVAGGGGPAGGLAVADPRAPERGGYKATKYRVTHIKESSGAVIGASTTGNGAYAVADARVSDRRRGALGVRRMDQSSYTVGGEGLPSNGAYAVADIRYSESFGTHTNKMRVVDAKSSSPLVTGSDRVGSGALSVADVRWREGREAYLSAGHYGVMPWQGTAGGITASGQHDNGRWSIADPRPIGAEAIAGLPVAEDRLIAVIRALDGTWHRPFTTLELAALQGLFDPDETFELDGLSDSAWRERIGNAVPPPAAKAVADEMGRTLLLAWAGETFQLSNTKIWVRQIPAALMAASEGFAL